MSAALSCPRCAGPVVAPNLMRSDWHCPVCGSVVPLHVVAHPAAPALTGVVDRLREALSPLPLWCPWPLPRDWTVTGLGWVGDERAAPRATALVLSGPAPLVDGPADVVFVAEEPAVGLGMRLAGVVGFDPGRPVGEVSESTPPHAKVRAAGHPTPLWAVATPDDRSAYVGEAKGMWLCVIAWPAVAGYLLAEELALHDLVESTPSELVFGAPTHRLSQRSAAG